MKFLLVSVFCCTIFVKSFSKSVEEVDDFKILKGDYGTQDDENVRAIVHPGLLECFLLVMESFFWGFPNLCRL
jgi:hypothetical protein